MKKFLFFLCLFLFYQSNFAQGRLEIRNYSFKNTKNKTVKLSDFKGKVVIMDFWASWCQPCVKSFPTTTEVLREFEGKDLVFLTINTDKEKRKWKPALKDYHPPGIALYAKKKNPILRALAVEHLPRYVILDKKGLVYFYEASSPYESKAVIRQLLKE